MINPIAIDLGISSDSRFGVYKMQKTRDFFSDLYIKKYYSWGLHQPSQQISIRFFIQSGSGLVWKTLSYSILYRACHHSLQFSHLL